MGQDFAPSDWITTNEAAQLTGYTPGYIRKAIYRDRLPATKLGRDWVLRKDDVLEYAERMKNLGSSKHDPWRTGARRSNSDD